MILLLWQSCFVLFFCFFNPPSPIMSFPFRNCMTQRGIDIHFSTCTVAPTKMNNISYSPFYFTTSVATRTNSCVPCSQMSVWWIAPWGCYVGWGFFGEQHVWHTKHGSVLHLSFLRRTWSNSRSSFGFPRSEQVPDFLDARYFSGLVKTHRH